MFDRCPLDAQYNLVLAPPAGKHTFVSFFTDAAAGTALTFKSVDGLLVVTWGQFTFVSSVRVYDNLWYHVAFSWRSSDGRLVVQARAAGCTGISEDQVLNVQLGCTLTFDGAFQIGRPLVPSTRAGDISVVVRREDANVTANVTDPPLAADMSEDLLGLFDNVRVWDYALDTTTLIDTSTRLLPVPPPGLVLDLTLDQAVFNDTTLLLLNAMQYPAPWANFSGVPSKDGFLPLYPSCAVNVTIDQVSPPVLLASTLDLLQDTNENCQFYYKGLYEAAQQNCTHWIYSDKSPLNEECGSLGAEQAFYYQACVCDIAKHSDLAQHRHSVCMFAQHCNAIKPGTKPGMLDYHCDLSFQESVTSGFNYLVWQVAAAVACAVVILLLWALLYRRALPAPYAVVKLQPFQHSWVGEGYLPDDDVLYDLQGVAADPGIANYQTDNDVIDFGLFGFVAPAKGYLDVAPDAAALLAAALGPADAIGWSDNPAYLDHPSAGGAVAWSDNPAYLQDRATVAGAGAGSGPVQWSENPAYLQDRATAAGAGAGSGPAQWSENPAYLQDRATAAAAALGGTLERRGNGVPMRASVGSTRGSKVQSRPSSGRIVMAETSHVGLVDKMVGNPGSDWAQQNRKTAHLGANPLFAGLVTPTKTMAAETRFPDAASDRNNSEVGLGSDSGDDAQEYLDLAPPAANDDDVLAGGDIPWPIVREMAARHSEISMAAAAADFDSLSAVERGAPKRVSLIDIASLLKEKGPLLHRPSRASATLADFSLGPFDGNDGDDDSNEYLVTSNSPLRMGAAFESRSGSTSALPRLSAVGGGLEPNNAVVAAHGGFKRGSGVVKTGPDRSRETADLQDTPEWARAQISNMKLEEKVLKATPQVERPAVPVATFEMPKLRRASAPVVVARSEAIIDPLTPESPAPGAIQASATEPVSVPPLVEEEVIGAFDAADATSPAPAAAEAGDDWSLPLGDDIDYGFRGMNNQLAGSEGSLLFGDVSESGASLPVVVGEGSPEGPNPAGADAEDMYMSQAEAKLSVLSAADPDDEWNLPL